MSFQHFTWTNESSTNVLSLHISSFLSSNVSNFFIKSLFLSFQVSLRYGTSCKKRFNFTFYTNFHQFLLCVSSPLNITTLWHTLLRLASKRETRSHINFNDNDTVTMVIILIFILFYCFIEFFVRETHNYDRFFLLFTCVHHSQPSIKT